MNQQQIVNKLSYIAAQCNDAGLLRSQLFSFIADVCKEGVTSAETYNARLFPSDVRQEIILRDHFACTYCNRIGTVDLDPDGEYWDIDHVVPYGKGGLTCADNGVLSCSECNSKKRDMTPAQYIKWLRFNIPVVIQPISSCDERDDAHVEIKSTVDGRFAVTDEMIDLYVRNGSWEDAAQRFFTTYRDADHIDWVKAMAELANDGRPYTAFKGGLSSNLFHKYSPKGKERMRLVA